MALHPDFPGSPYAILEPAIRWFPADEALRDTRPFVAKEQGYLISKKSVFNKIIGDSAFELVFANFLEGCDDVISYAKNYMAVHFKLDYVNAEGDISTYYPDFIVKVSAKKVVIAETKGQEELGCPTQNAAVTSVV